MGAHRRPGRHRREGRLTITGRRDERIVTSLGTNVDPVYIERALESESPHIAHACVVGHGRPHLVALISAPAGDDAGVAAAVDRVNEQLPETSRIRGLVVVGDQWLPGGDEATPTMKLRRAAVQSLYADRIESLYSREHRLGA